MILDFHHKRYFFDVLNDIELEDGWPESEQEHSHKCMYDFHQKREGDRDLVCGDVREGGRERERGRERRCEDAKMRRCEDNIRRCENEKL